MAEKKPSSTRIEQAAVVKTIGARMREARELCNMSQSAAARRLGYSNPSKLSKVEGATDTNSVPLWLIVRAASVYEVSIDYLFGCSDDWEAGSRMTQERDVSGWMFDIFSGEVKKWMKEVRTINDRIECQTKAVVSLLSAIEDVDAAMKRFVEINPSFDDMRGGATLAARIDGAIISAKSASVSMRRFHCELRAAAAQRTPYIGDENSPIKDLLSGIV